MEYYIIAVSFAVGVLIGMIIGLIIERTKKIGALRIQEQDGDTMIFLELECEVEELRKKRSVRLRVENSPYYETNQNY